MPRYAWGQATEDFPNSEYKEGVNLEAATPDEHKLFVDGVEINWELTGEAPDYVDTDKMEYRVVVPKFMRNGDIKRVMKRARHSMRLILHGRIVS